MLSTSASVFKVSAENQPACFSIITRPAEDKDGKRTEVVNYQGKGMKAAGRRRSE